jgi:Zn-dependent M28 family amino/carboxypeptidase
VPVEPSTGGPYLLLKPEAAVALRAVAAGTPVSFKVEMGQPELRTTQNVLGVIHGSGPDADAKAILLSAHYDHLGIRDGVLYPGADDDASGTTAVLEFARLIGKGAKPRRTVYFALFGCEEEGGLGASYYRAHPPAPLATLAANLEFEMIGLRDPKHPDELMLTGWERSNLGPTLAAHGAKIGPDPYPEQNFFQRSDNYQLALKGVVAQTVGGWAMPPTYHQPSDDLAHIDIGFMAGVVQSMAEPVRWLLDSDFVPAWNEGQRP